MPLPPQATLVLSWPAIREPAARSPPLPDGTGPRSNPFEEQLVGDRSASGRP